MGHFAAGVTVLTTVLGERLHGITVSAFASLSLEPPMVLACLEKKTVMHDLLLKSRRFAVNILSEEDEAVSRYFADNSRLKGTEFTPGTYRAGSNGSPILLGATAFAEANVVAGHDGGDHTIFVGEVTNLGVLSERRPLVFYRGGYRSLS
jgi:flavin reductase (DIM6/NTAB) family NADH-FMN oxidoreductase RutF